MTKFPFQTKCTPQLLPESGCHIANLPHATKPQPGTHIHIIPDITLKFKPHKLENALCLCIPFRFQVCIAVFVVVVVVDVLVVVIFVAVVVLVVVVFVVVVVFAMTSV